MILRLRQHPRDHPALLGDTQALLVAQGLEIDLAHENSPDRGMM